VDHDGSLGPRGSFPEGIACALEAKRVFVSDQSGGGELVIDGVNDKALARIPIGGEAGNSRYDPGATGHGRLKPNLDQYTDCSPVRRPAVSLSGG
jgi:hypothetical protein